MTRMIARIMRAVGSCAIRSRSVPAGTAIAHAAAVHMTAGQTTAAQMGRVRAALTRRALVAAAALSLACLPWPVMAQAVNDYPTNARAEYVFTCMATNGQNRDMLDRCSCSIDRIAEVLPYENYVDAETVLRMQQTTGERSAMFKGTSVLTNFVAELRRAEAEAEIICF